MTAFVFIAAFCFGAVIGSFLNVCIYRLPRQVSIIHPGSACPACRTPIPFYLNIPILSYLILRGRCHHCGQKVSLRYPLVEILTGVAAAGTLLRFGMNPQALFWFFLICALITVSMIDYDVQIIPDIISLPGIPLCVLGSVLTGYHGWADALIGVLAGGGSLYLVAVGYRLLRNIDGMGGGDIKLLAMIGGAVGWQGVLFTIFTGSVLGTLAGITAMGVQRRLDPRLKIPFGPYLSAGAVGYLFFGTEMMQWYFQWFYTPVF